MAAAATIVAPMATPFVDLGIAVARSAHANNVVGGVGDVGWIVGATGRAASVATGARSMLGGECLVGFGLGAVLLAEFLKDEK